MEPLEAMRISDLCDGFSPAVAAENEKYKKLLERCHDGTEGVEFYQGLASGLRLMQSLTLEDVTKKPPRRIAFLRASGMYDESLKRYLEAAEGSLRKI